MLTRVAYPSIAGINGVAWDAVELPSQFMENFVWRTEVLPLISAHVDSGEPLPVDMLQRLLGTRTFNAALDTLRQIELASFDFELHANYDPQVGARVGGDPRAGAATGGGRAGRALQPDADEFRPHIRRRLRGGLLQLQMGRSAGRRCVRGVRSRPACSTAPPPRAFVDSILARGGSLDAMEAFVRFRGRAAGRSAAAQADGYRRVKCAAAALALALLAANARAATAYVSDELVLGVYAEQNNQGQRLTTLHSGASVETLATSGEFTQVRLSDGTTGWVKSTYLTTHEPAIVRVKQLQEELDRSRATTPALAEAAARSEEERLRHELAAMQSELDAARAARAEPATVAGARRRPNPSRRSHPFAPCSLLPPAASGWVTPLWPGASSRNSAASRYISKRALFISKRALFIGNWALFIGNWAFTYRFFGACV